MLGRNSSSNGMDHCCQNQTHKRKVAHVVGCSMQCSGEGEGQSGISDVWRDMPSRPEISAQMIGCG